MSLSSQEAISGSALQDHATSDGRQNPKQKSRRGYVACIPCRTRKVRCVLDAEPPCAKCRREHRQCVFEDQHKSVRHRDPPQWTRKAGLSAQQLQQTVLPSQEGSVPGEGPSSTRLPSMPQQQTPSNMGDQRQETSPTSTNQSLAESLLSTVMTRPGNALDLLFDVAQARTTQTSTEKSGAVGHLDEHAAVCTSPQVTSSPPQFQGSAITQLSVPSTETLDLWDKSRFVRQGLVTAQEVVTYLDLYEVSPIRRHS